MRHSPPTASMSTGLFSKLNLGGKVRGDGVGLRWLVCAVELPARLAPSLARCVRVRGGVRTGVRAQKMEQPGVDRTPPPCRRVWRCAFRHRLPLLLSSGGLEDATIPQKAREPASVPETVGARTKHAPRTLPQVGSAESSGSDVMSLDVAAVVAVLQSAP